MEVTKNCEKQNEEENEEEGPLPGFRFHPTDEEIVGFYLKRKVENKRPLSIQIIKQIDIYKHDPWDLPKAINSEGDKEWYFYCKRGRKYRNSIRPNRVTGSGFWKATGIDKPVYSNLGGEGGRPQHCIGLKKSLVYYRGSAGKGTKTDWMMHEFRLPSDLQQLHDQPYVLSKPKDTSGQEAEIWTLCRIFKRNKRHSPDWRELSARKNAMPINSSSKTSSLDSTTNNHQPENYISFTNQSNNNATIDTNDPVLVNNHDNINMYYFHLNHHQQQQQQQQQQRSSVVVTNNPSTTSTYSSSLNNLTIEYEKDMESFGYYGNNWDDLSSVVEFAVKSPLV